MLRASLGVVAWLALTGHSPYGQWGTFRKSRLIVFADAEDARSQQLAQALAARIDAALPKSRATWARAPTALDLVKLLASHQADVILLPRHVAAQVRAGDGRFAAVGALPLQLIGATDGYLLLCLDEYPSAHAWQIAQAMASDPSTEAPIPMHPGAADYRSGKPMPASDEHRH